MPPIRSFEAICSAHGLSHAQMTTLQSLRDARRGVLHPFWIQIALLMPSHLINPLYSDLIANEWAIPDQEEINGVLYETALSDSEIAMGD